MWVCVSCSDEFDYIALSNFGLFKELRYQLHSIFDKNLSTAHGWTFAKFFEVKKNVKCRCIDKKNLSVLWGKKNLSVRRKIFKVWGRGKKCKCRISGVRKKKWKLKEKFRKKKSKCLRWKLKLKLRKKEKKKIIGRNVDWEVQSHGLILKDKIAVAERKKNQGFIFTGFVPTGWAPCCETWLKFEVKDFHCSKKLKLKKCSGRGLPR